ncbi:MAG: hypothetical protein DRI44_06785 [Chlamydiae bacterium]|nr:MAG: hypothetical protein DRI44_06785 [Chlamydiota bacterium]
MNFSRYSLIFILVFTFSSFASEQPVKLAARAVARDGILEFGVRNNTCSNVSGVIKFENADGVELLANGFGFNLTSKETEYRSIPIKNLTKDLPFLTCDVIVFNNSNSKLYINKIQCKSGALFRDIGGSKPTSKSLKPATIRIIRGTGLEKNFLSFYFHKKLLIKNFCCRFSNFQIKWEKVDTDNQMELIGKAFNNYIFAKSNVVADVKLSIEQNNHGDCMIVFSYTLLEQLPDDSRNPYVDLIIPRRIAENDLVTLKHDTGKVKLVFLDDISDSDLIKENKNINEFSIITKNDWMTFYLDSSYLNVWNILPKSTPDKRAGLIRLRIRSRVEWKPPFLPARSGTIQFFIHFPVGIQKN